MNHEHCYSIGVAARLARVSTHTLRKWEDRYGAVTPRRTSGGKRRYSADEVARLTLLKELTALGHAIGSIASLPTSTLQEMASERVEPTVAKHDRLRVAVLGESLSIQLERQGARLYGIEVVGSAKTAESLASVTADVLIVETNSLTENCANRIRQLRQTTGIERIAILYAFAPLAVAENLSDARTAVMRLPVNYRELERTLQALVNAKAVVTAPRHMTEPRISRQSLARVISASPTLTCECPRHVAELIILLSNFEAYSMQCVQDNPKDAQLHGQLQHTAAASRALFEQALIEIATLENIALEDD